jgi:hypothetical protein
MKTHCLKFLLVAALNMKSTAALALSTIQTTIPYFRDEAGIMNFGITKPPRTSLSTTSTLSTDSSQGRGGGKSIVQQENTSSPVDELTQGRRAALSLIAAGLTGLLVGDGSKNDDAKRRGGGAGVMCSEDASSNKLHNLSNEEMAEILIRDCREKRSLFTGEMTRSIYDENARFKDGSDIDGSYSINAWIRGCKFLFDENESRCAMLDHTLSVTPNHATFRFTEILQFRAFFRPRVHISGTVVMKRDEGTGLIVSYEEKWDRNVGELLEKFTVWDRWGR